MHLASIGHPIASDYLYAQERAPLFGFTRPALHAYSVALELEGAEYTFVALSPQELASNYAPQ